MPRGSSPQQEQKEVTGSESLFPAQEWQEFSDFNSLRKTEHRSWKAVLGAWSLPVFPTPTPSTHQLHIAHLRSVRAEMKCEKRHPDFMLWTCKPQPEVFNSPCRRYVSGSCVQQTEALTESHILFSSCLAFTMVGNLSGEPASSSPLTLTQLWVTAGDGAYHKI